MQKNNFFQLIMVAVIFFSFSCKKFLDEKSNALLIIPSSLKDLQYLLDDATTMNYSTPTFGVASSDDYFIDNNTFNSKSLFIQHVYKWLPYPYTFQNDWSQSYKVIYISNLCLERIEGVKRTGINAKEWDHIKGSALFYKVYNELELAWIFAKSYDKSTATTDMGIVIRKNTDFTETSVRSTLEETYDHVIRETKMASTLLDDVPLVSTRPSKCAAYALLARAYLSMRQYDSASKYADLALKIRSSLMDYNDPGIVSISATNPFKLFNEEVIFHSTFNLTFNLHNPSTGPARVDSILYESYHSNDLRKRAFFTAVSGYYRFKGSYSAGTSRMFSGIAIDELFLIRAECKVRLGNKAEGLSDLNTLLQKRFAAVNFVPVNASTDEIALALVLQERRKELLFRGTIRWMDIKRLNKEHRGIILQRKIANEVFTLPPNDNRYALPIPTDIIELTGIQQN